MVLVDSKVSKAVFLLAFLPSSPWPPILLSLDDDDYYFFLPREILRHGLQKISDMVKSLLPKLEIPDHFNSSGWPLNETPPLVINMSLSTFMIFWNIICHSFYLHRASFKLLKMWVIFLQLLTMTHHGTGCSENQLWKTGADSAFSLEWDPRFLNSCHGAARLGNWEVVTPLGAGVWDSGDRIGAEKWVVLAWYDHLITGPRGPFQVWTCRGGVRGMVANSGGVFA